ncbi:MAG: DUF2071 domain-containing protein, partial [Deltaproteobacteria bacterium]
MDFLSGRFRHILLFNYAVEPELLTPYLPAFTELDFHRGNCFLSLVGVQLQDLKVYGIPFPLHRNYAQVNLRFYVRRRLGNGACRSGVVFLRQVVPHRIIAWGARRIFNEKAVRHRIDCTLREVDQQSSLVEYGWYNRQQRHFIKAAFQEQSYFEVPAAERKFFVERHWGYCSQKDGGCLEYRFDHPPWPAYRALDASEVVSVGDFYGPPFTSVFDARPDSVFACRGSTILLGRGLRLHQGNLNPMTALPQQPG